MSLVTKSVKASIALVVASCISLSACQVDEPLQVSNDEPEAGSTDVVIDLAGSDEPAGESAGEPAGEPGREVRGLGP